METRDLTSNAQKIGKTWGEIKTRVFQLVCTHRRSSETTRTIHCLNNINSVTLHNFISGLNLIN